MAAFQGALILIFRDVFLPPLAANVARVPPAAWVLSLAVAAFYVAYSARALPTIQRYLWNLSTFKLAGLALAVPASILEEVFFRQYVMDALVRQSALVQILASALAFGLAHAIWGVRGGWRAAAGAVGSTTLMGAALAIVYLASGRVVLPCVVSHFLITAILEPWLIYAYAERAAATA
jgi:hypothetical protein